MRPAVAPSPIVLSVFLLLAGVPHDVSSAEPGFISGRVTDATTGEPVPNAQIVIVGTTLGTIAMKDGTYVLRSVPPGVHDLRLMMMGYEDQTKEGVPVRPGQETRLDFAIVEALVDIGIPEIVVTAPPTFDRQMEPDADQGHLVDEEDLKTTALDTPEEVLALKPGVIAQAGLLYIRGARAGAAQVQIDGVPVKDPLGGDAFSPAMLSIDNVEMILGGQGAEYGNAKSGVILYKTKEGGDRFGGEFRYTTDDFGAPDDTFDNLDRLFLGVGGPSPVENLTYYVSAEAVFMDGYPKSPEKHSRRRVLNFISIGDRQTNSLKLHGKLALQAAPGLKFTFQVIDDRSKRDEYHHMWTWSGYVEAYLDTTRTGTVVRRLGRTSQTPVDSTYHYYNAAEHTPDVHRRFGNLRLTMNHFINEDTRYTLRLSRNSFFLDRRVKGKEPWEYDGTQDSDFFFNHRDREPSEFFVIGGDYPVLLTRETKVYTAKCDFTRIEKSHRIQAGLELNYNDMRLFSVERSYRTSPDGEIGFPNTRYHYYQPDGSVYVQDQWKHEGMVLNVGLRFDALSVGDQIPISEVRNRWKKQWSPRVGIAYPITDRDVFSFHYGRYYQFPERRFVFDDRNVFDDRPRGNPNLENETSVSYQAGVQHLFSRLAYGQFSVYYRDVFGLVTAERRPDPTGTGNVTVYVNRDYASARGFEFSLARDFKDGFRCDLSYTFGVATGVASDPNASISRNFLYLPVSEQPLSWDARHALSAHLYVADPGSWGVDMVWSYTSGFPYTPTQRDTRDLGPEAVHSRRLPGTSQLNVSAEKYYSMWGQRLKVFVNARNALDTKNIRSLAGGDLLTPPAFADYEVYYTETGRAGGAYLGDDADGDGIEDWVPLYDPQVFAEPRVVRMGVALQF